MRRAAQLMHGVALALLAAACTSPEAPPMRLGATTWPGYEPLYLALDIGALSSDVAALNRMGSATEVLAAFRAGRLDAAALTLDEAMQLLGHGRDPQVVLVLDTSHGGDAVVGHAGLKDMADLKGRRLGAERTGVGAYMASRALQSAGLTPDDVTMVDIPADRHAGAFLAGDVDAIVTFEPVKSALLLAGGVELFNSARIPGEIVDVLVVDRPYLARHPDQVRRLIHGWFAALNFLDDHPRDAAGYMSPRLHLMPQGVVRALSGLDFPDRDDNLRLLIGEHGVPALAAPASRLAQTMRDLGLLRGDVRPSALFAPGSAPHPLVAMTQSEGD